MVDFMNEKERGSKGRRGTGGRERERENIYAYRATADTRTPEVHRHWQPSCPTDSSLRAPSRELPNTYTSAHTPLQQLTDLSPKDGVIGSDLNNRMWKTPEVQTGTHHHHHQSRQPQ
jgi:hypothetical protein